MLPNITNALVSIWSNKIRSLLNILGVVIGVASVTTLIALGQGLKNDVASLIQDFGTNVLVVTGGKLEAGGATQSNPANFITGDILTAEDVATIESIENIEAVTPTSLVAGTLRYGEKLGTPTLTGSYPNLPEALEVLKIDKGRMFTKRNEGNVIVLGPAVAKQLFDSEDPIGKKVMLNREEFEVIGTFTETGGSISGSEFASFSLVPYDTATVLNNGEEKIVRIYAKANDNADVESVKRAIEERITANHDGEEDFTVLTQEDMLDLFNTFLNLATTMVSAIAAISLLVGGIGIMNIMLVTVTERTREIGLRKAVGATKMAILWQFLTEAVVVTFVGSLIGLLIAFAASAIVASQTDLQPAITPSIILLAVGIAVIVGIIFGLWPAIRAAQKDPIEALRYE